MSHNATARVTIQRYHLGKVLPDDALPVSVHVGRIKRTPTKLRLR